MGARYAAAVVFTEIWPTPPAIWDREPPKKFPKPTPKVVRESPTTFWLERSVTVSTL